MDKNQIKKVWGKDNVSMVQTYSGEELEYSEWIKKYGNASIAINTDDKKVKHAKQNEKRNKGFNSGNIDI